MPPQSSVIYKNKWWHVTLVVSIATCLQGVNGCSSGPASRSPSGNTCTALDDDSCKCKSCLDLTFKCRLLTSFVSSHSRCLLSWLAVMLSRLAVIAGSSQKAYNMICRHSLTSSDSMPSVPPWCNLESKPLSGSAIRSSSRRILNTYSDSQLPSQYPHPFWGSWMWTLGTLGALLCSGISTLVSTWKVGLPWWGQMVSLFGQLYSACSFDSLFSDQFWRAGMPGCGTP